MLLTIWIIFKVLEILSQFNGLKPNPLIFLSIAISMIIFQLFLYQINDETKLNHATMFMSLFSQGILAITSLYMVKRHYKTEVFGKSYIFLFIGIISVLVGDLMYNVLLMFNYNPHSFITDGLFIVFYLFMSLHLYMIVKNFKRGFDRKDAVVMFSVILITVLAYSIFTYNKIHEFNFDFYYGMIFVFGSAVVAGFAMIGLKTFKKIPLGRPWMIITVGILLGTIADVWYIYADITGFFTLDHGSNQLWYASYFVILYGIFKTTKAI
jgi:hypothetical protein